MGKIDLKMSVPQFLRDAEPLSTIYDSIDIEMESIYTEMDDVKHQFSISTATWGLDHWEAFLGIQTNPSKSHEFRRSVILSKIRGVGKVTKSFLEETCKSFENGSLEVVEVPEESRLVLKFTELNGVPPNFGDFDSFVSEVIPAHLVYAYEYKYNTYGRLTDKTNDSLALLTYEEIRTTNQWN